MKNENILIRVLIASHIGNPWGGISTLFDTILQSDLKDKFDLIFFESSISQQKSSAGDLSIQAIFHSLKSIFLYSFAIIKHQPKIVHIATAHKGSFVKHGVMVVIAKIFGRKVILAPHCSVFALLPDHSPKIWKRWVKFITNQCDYLLVLSKEWFKFPSQLPLNNLIYLPNAINTLEYLSIDREFSEKSKSTNILFLGHISVEKGLLDLVDAISILTQDNILNFSVDLIGESINHLEFEEIMQQIDVKKLANYINAREPEFGQKKIERLKSADIFVLPSHQEGMPMTILEAMASGLPVVATSVGGIPDLIINGKNGYLVPPNDPTKLSDALKEMIQNPSLRFQIGKDNREKAKQSYDIEKYVEKLGAVYLALANG